MNKRLRPSTVAALSLAFTYLFFFEYLPPFRRVLLPFDLQNYHYPQLDYAFQAVRHGSFPEWDPTIYCGQSFVGNIQAALFYPPTWLMFAANFNRQSLSYQSLEDLVLAHVWLAFFLCYLWLRHKKLAELACVLGAAVFAYSGYMLNQLQHLGVVAGYAWMPLGFWGIDQAVEEKRWQPLWKPMVASALCLLAGYPPTWFVFAVCMVSYAAWRWRVALGVVLAIAASLAIAAVQLLPTYEATAMKAFEPRYGNGVRNPEAYISYFLPNYCGFGMRVSHEAWKGNYLYLGVPAFLGLLALARRRKWPDLIPPLAILAVSLVIVTNPFNAVWEIIRHSSWLAQICRDWYFLAGLTLAAAPLTAFGIDYCLSRARRPVPAWCPLLACLLLIGWSARQLLVWFPAGSDFLTGWKSAIEPTITLALFSLGIFILPSQRGTARASLVAAILLAVAVDYKVFGTSRWVNASEGDVSNYRTLPKMDEAVFRQVRANSAYRIAVDLNAFIPALLQHYGLTTPQGFDPLITKQYGNLMARIEHVRPNSTWEIDIDPANEAALGLLGIRYFITAGDRALYAQLLMNPHFRRLEPSSNFYQVFEFLNARPPYGWESNAAESSAQRIRWTPEAREFLVRSETGGRFTLSEQFFPGWQATVEGKPARIERWSEAFQAVDVPPGEHSVAFRFRSSGLRVGAIVSLCAILSLAFFSWRQRRI
jgi:hypothetical protein